MADNREDRLARLDADDAAADYADLGALYVNLVPVFGGVVSQVLNGWSAERRYQRVKEVLGSVARDLAQIKDRVREEYVRSDEFADLLDQTLRRVVNERNQEKRRLYRGLLVDATTSATYTYDEQIHMLQVIDSLQGAHIAVLGAILAEPPKGYSEGFTSTFLTTLRGRLHGVSEERIIDLVTHLKDHHLANVGNLQSHMTSEGAQDMRSTLTPFGKRLVDYLKKEDTDGATRGDGIY